MARGRIIRLMVTVGFLVWDLIGRRIVRGNGYGYRRLAGHGCRASRGDGRRITMDDGHIFQVWDGLGYRGLDHPIGDLVMETTIGARLWCFSSIAPRPAATTLGGIR